MPLTITNTQFDLLRKSLDVNYYLPKLVDHIRHNYSTAPVVTNLSDDDLTAKVRRTLHRAWDLQLFSQADVFTFAVYDLVYFPCFGQHSQIQNLLKNSTAPPDMHMLTLCSQLTALDWKRLKEECELLASELELNSEKSQGKES